MDHNDRLRQSDDRRKRETREKQYETWAERAVRIHAELTLTDTEITLMEAEIALTNYEIAEMEVA